MKRNLKGLDFDSIIMAKIVAAVIMLVLTSLSIGKTGYWGEMSRIKLGNMSLSLPFLPLRSLFQMPEIAVYLVFGVIFASLRSNRTRPSQEFTEHPTFDFFADLMLFFAFHKLILLPACGFGYAQWATLAVVYVFEGCHVFQSHIEKKFDFDEVQILVLGSALWLIKLIVRYAFPQDLSADILKNDTAMNILTILIVFATVYGIKTMVSVLKIVSKKDVIHSAVKTAAGVAKKIVGLFMKLISFIINMLLTIIVNPVVLLVVACVVALLFVLSGFLFVANVDSEITHISNDIKSFIAPIMQTALSTDNPAYADDMLNTIGNACSYIAFVVILLFEKNTIRKIKEEKRQIEIEEKEEAAAIEQHKQTEYDIFFGGIHTNKTEKTQI